MGVRPHCQAAFAQYRQIILHKNSCVRCILLLVRGLFGGRCITAVSQYILRTLIQQYDCFTALFGIQYRRLAAGNVYVIQHQPYLVILLCCNHNLSFLQLSADQVGSRRINCNFPVFTACAAAHNLGSFPAEHNLNTVRCIILRTDITFLKADSGRCLFLCCHG